VADPCRRRRHAWSVRVESQPAATDLADHLVEGFAPFRERRATLAATPGVARDVLAAGADKVRPVARETIEIVRDAMHLR